jgi:S-adenosylmethionine decarboxylase
LKNIDLSSDSIGRHVLCDLHGIKNAELFDNEKIMSGIMLTAATMAGMTVVGSAWKKFEPQGLTGTLLLSTSHMSMHFWPEKQFMSIDVYTCGPEGDPQVAIDYIISKLRPDMKKSKVVNLDRSIYREVQPFGYSYLIDGFGCKSIKDLDDMNLAYNFLNELTEAIGMTKQSEPNVVRTDATRFPDKRGLSGAIFLVESSITIHTISTADKKFVTVDVYSCKPYDKEVVKKMISKFYHPKMFSKEQFLERGVEYHSFSDSIKVKG